MNKKSLPVDTYSVWVNGGNIVHLQEQTKPTMESTAAMAKEVTAITQTHAATKALFDLSAVSGLPPSGARKNVSEMLRKSGLEKVAVFGTSTPIRIVAGFVMRAAGMKNVEFFPTEKEALQWLQAS